MLLMTTAVLHGLFPILVHAGTHVLPPLYFSAICLLIGAGCSFLMLLGQKHFLLCVLKASQLRDVVVVTFLNLIIPIALIAEGTRLTSGINTALLLQAEILFTFIVCNVLLRQKTHALRLLGALSVFLGTLLILLQGSYTLNRGDLSIVLATAFYPFGNLISKRLVASLDVLTIIFLRSLIAGLLLLGFSAILEDVPMAISVTLMRAWWLVGLQGFFVFFLSKYLWYEGLKVLSVPRAVFIVSSAPAWSLLFAVVFLHEIPDMAQLIGFGITLIGVFLLTAHFPRKMPPVSALRPTV